MKNLTKVFPKFLFLFLCLSFFIISCHKDDTSVKDEVLFEESTKETKARHISGREIPKIVEYVEKRTNYTMRVDLSDSKMRLADGNINARSSAMGIVQTNKVVEVQNENNTKYTFNVKNEQNPNDKINLIVVDSGGEPVEYFIKYEFDPNSPFERLSSGAIDMSTFTGTIRFFDNSGEQMGMYTFTEGNSNSLDGVTSPDCEEDNTDNTSDDTDSSDDTTGGGDNTSGDGGNDDGSTGGGSDGSSGDSGNGGGGEGESFDEAQACELSWSFEACGCGGDANGHEPQQGVSCCEGSPLVVTNSCTGQTWSSRSNSSSSRTEGLEPDPCNDGDAGVILDDILCTMDDESYNAFFSRKAPFSVDLSSVRDSCEEGITTPDENKKFMCIYNKLSNNPSFKNLFIDTFGESTDYNITIKLSDFPESIAGKNTATPDNINNQLIEINKNHLSNKHPLTIAQTILHEALHAYLKAKKYQCSTEVTIEELNSQEIDGILENMDYSCISTATNEHTLMFDVLVPKMTQILSELKNELVIPEEQNPVAWFYPPPSEDQEAFNWNDCYFNMSLVGLGEASSFSTITDDPRKKYFFNNYNARINDPLAFTQSTCNE